MLTREGSTLVNQKNITTQEIFCFGCDVCKCRTLMLAKAKEGESEVISFVYVLNRFATKNLVPP